MKIYRDIKQRSDEWYAVRRGKMTASRAREIMTNGRGGKGWGQTVLSYAKELALERLDIPVDPLDAGFKSKAMEWGEEHEDFVRNAYAMANEVEVEQVGFVEMDEFVGCSPDGLVGEDGVLEIKCPQPKAHLDYILDGFTDHYPQAQFLLFVTGRKWVDLVSWNPLFPEEHQFLTYRFERDETYIESLKERVGQVADLLDNILKALEVKVAIVS